MFDVAIVVVVVVVVVVVAKENALIACCDTSIDEISLYVRCYMNSVLGFKRIKRSKSAKFKRLLSAT